jgi:polysaccharide pyruvyl transferase CsaB
MRRNKLRIGISGSYGGLNLGDEAILQAILAEIRGSIDAEILVFARDAEDTRRRHGVEAITTRELSRDESRAEIATLDVFVLGGGGILYDGGVEAYLRELRLAQELGLATMIYAISAGPLVTPAARKLVRDSLEHTDVITVRDRQTRQLLEEIGVHREIMVTADPALLLEAEPLAEDVLQREGIDASRPLIGLSVREPGPAAPDLNIDQYHALLADAADYMVDRYGAHIVFVPLERKAMDIQHGHAVISRMHNAEHAMVLKSEYSAAQMVSLVGRFEFALGMRLHFLIFAAMQGVPFVALPYASKVRGFIEEMELPMPPLSEVSTGRLLAMIDRSWDLRGEIRQTIGRNLPRLRERARESTARLVELVQSRSRPGIKKNSDATVNT